jgi:hypothetical protein
MSDTNPGWFKAMRGEEPLELIQANPLACVLALVIAHRARWRDGFNQHGLSVGEAFLGDFEAYGMSERQYRTAKDCLAKWGFATFKATNKGTIGKLTDARLFSVILDQSDEQNADERRTSDGQPATNEERKNKEGHTERADALPEIPPMSRKDFDTLA